MFSVATLWIPFTIVAALGQVARNAMQRSLTGPLGTWGATNIRFLFGFPFSIVFFVVVIVVSGDRVPWPTAAFWPWLLLGALSQIIATGMMLLAMNDRSFVVTTAYLKTEAIQTAIFGFVFLGDHLTVLKVVAILIATAGVVLAALRPGAEKGFTDLDTHSPYALQGGDEALGLKRSHVPKVALAGAMTGMFGGMGMMVWMNGLNWPLNVGGRPPVSPLAYVPITFETTVRSALTARAPASG